MINFFLLNLASVTNLWIFGAFCLCGAFAFFFDVKVLLIIFFFINAATPSPFSNPYNFLIPETLLGPSLLDLVTSVKPGIYFSPFLTRTNERALISGPTMQPRTDFLLRSPVLLGL